MYCAGQSRRANERTNERTRSNQSLFVSAFFKFFFSFNIQKGGGGGRIDGEGEMGNWILKKAHSFTLPVLFSTQIAFFLGSIQRGPARTALMVEGGVWRRPGPSLRGFDALEGIGRSSVGIISPGMTNAAGILSPLFFFFFLAS